MITKKLTKEDIGKIVLYNKKTKGKIVSFDNKLRAMLVDFNGVRHWCDRYYLDIV